MPARCRDRLRGGVGDAVALHEKIGQPFAAASGAADIASDHTSPLAITIRSLARRDTSARATLGSQLVAVAPFTRCTVTRAASRGCRRCSTARWLSRDDDDAGRLEALDLLARAGRGGTFHLFT